MRTAVLTLLLILSFTAAAGAGEPTVAYTFAKYLSVSSAEMHAGIRPNGSSFTLHFTCSVISPGSGGTTRVSSTPQYFPADSGLVEIIQPVYGLTQDTSCLYSYWVVVTSQSGRTFWGQSQDGRTGDPITAPKVMTLPPDSVAQRTVRLSAICNTHGVLTDFSFLWSTSYGIFNGGSGEHVTFSSTTDTLISLQLPGLTPGVRYYFIANARGVNYPDLQISGEYDSCTTIPDSNARGIATPLTTVTSYGAVWTALNFGVHTYATRCIDVALGEAELPPTAPGFDIRFSDPHPAGGFCYGMGVSIDLRPLISPAQADTYAVKISADPDVYPVTFRWPDLTSSYSGQVLLKTIDTTLDMKTANSIVIGNTDVSRVTIIAAGPQPGDHIPAILLNRTEPTGANSVRLNALVNPNGLLTTSWFEWGPTEAYGSSSAQMPLNAANVAIPVSAELQNVVQNTGYHFRVATRNSTGTHYGPDAGFYLQGVTGVKSGPPDLPRRTNLDQNSPNPFNPSTDISFTTAGASLVSLKIYDVLGREVVSLVNGWMESGKHTVRWNAGDRMSGIYFYRLTAGPLSVTKKMALVR